MTEVVMHALKQLKTTYDIIILLQPTSPLRNSSDIDASLEFMYNNGGSLVSVMKRDHPLEWAFKLNGHKLTKFAEDAKKGKMRQDYADSFELNGAIYISYVSRFIDKQSFFDEETLAFTIPKERSIDIDSKFDFELAEYLLKK